MMRNSLWAMEESHLSECIDRYNQAIQDPEQMRMYLEAQDSFSFPTNFIEDENENRVAVIGVSGVLTASYTFFTWLMGGTSYSQLEQAIEDAENDPSISSVIFDFDTPGGEVSGVESAELAIRNMKKPNCAFVRGFAASAGYWLASATDNIYGLESSEAGSIGVVISVVDTSERDKKEGIKRYEITSKNAPDKRPDISKKEGRDILQKRVDDTEDVFVSHIAMNRGVAPETVRSDYGRGKVMLFNEAIEIGMVDGIKSFDDVRAEISKNVENDMEIKDLSLEQLKAERHDLVEAILDEGKQEGASAERERLSALEALKGSVAEANEIVEKAIENGKCANDITLDVLKAERAHKEQEKAQAKADVEADAEEMPEVTPAEAKDNADEYDKALAELSKFRKGDK